MASEQPHFNHHRSWLPLVLTGFTFLILFIVLLIPGGGEDVAELPSLSEQNEISSEILVSTYQSLMQSAIADYLAEGDREAFFLTLTTVRVPSDYLDPHVELTILADEFEYSEVALREYLATMQETYSWIN